ncbi:putative mucin/carbohydrate-binding domain-containing protein [Enterococcus faecalis]|uniref:putative mucin/carbohydrate-binding domain-containing protein n=2 Tax=Enterococcus faecalis TaxID=1351 RepID=UPI0029C7F3E0|nr:putative mucin/carbohydrate-binding domain-containing protein [Enterococcus faecalis]WPH38602.1 putative mucin/carbohydrate-binding domain-containing protein [Enterococcus faecalis]
MKSKKILYICLGVSLGFSSISTISYADAESNKEVTEKNNSITYVDSSSRKSVSSSESVFSSNTVQEAITSSSSTETDTTETSEPRNNKEDTKNLGENKQDDASDDSSVTSQKEQLKIKIMSLFSDVQCTKLSEDVTQEKIDKLKEKVGNSTDPQKEEILTLLSRATDLLQEFTFKGLGDSTFAQLYFYADKSYSCRLITKPVKPHSYIDKEYATITVMDNRKNTVYSKKYIGNQLQQAQSEALDLKEGYYLVINKTEPSRFVTNHNDQLKQNETNPYMYMVRNGELERINDKNRILHFLGLGNSEYATLKIDYNAMNLTLVTNNVKPHQYFTSSYEKIEVLDLQDKVIYTKDFIGNKQLEAETEKVPFEIGYKIRLTGSEHSSRVKSYDEYNDEVAMDLPKDQATLKIQLDNLEVMKSKYGSDLESEIMTLFSDSECTKLSEDVTQEKIDKLKEKVGNSTDPQKEEILTLLSRATDLLQEFTFKGLGDSTFAQLYFYADKSYSCRLITKPVKPHSYIDKEYATITVMDNRKNTVYSKKYIGNQLQQAQSEALDLKEGYYLVINKTEPSRFVTNHNDQLKQNETNPYMYMVRNGKLERINDKNRILHFLGLGNSEYATLKIDYNAMNLTLVTNNVKPHQYFTSSYEKIEVLDLQDKVIYTKDFIGNKQLEAETEKVPFEIGYKIRLTGSEHSSRVKSYDDNNIVKPIELSEKMVEIRIGKQGLSKVFLFNEKMNTTLQKNIETRLTKEYLNSFIKIDDRHKAFLNWLYGNFEAMQLYLDAGYATTSNQGGMSSYQFKNPYNLENEKEFFELWFKIWSKSDKSHQGTNLKIAISVAMEFNKEVSAWYNSSLKIDPIKRYLNYEDALQQGFLFEDFASLTVQETRNVVNAKITDDDMNWLRNYVKQNKPDMLTRSGITRGYTLIKYVMKNPETGVSVQSGNFYGPNPTIKEVIKYGGVCGAMSKLSCVLAQAYGVPAFPVGQPGHCAYIFLNSDHNYQLGYDVYGWKGCGNYNSTLPYIQINNYFSSHIDEYRKSEYFRYESAIKTNNSDKLKLLNESLKVEPLNYHAWNDKLLLLSESFDTNLYNEVKQDMNKSLKDYPVISEDIISNIYVKK